MTSIRFWPAALLAGVFAAALVVDATGQEQEPTLLGLIRKRLGKIPELQPGKGVRIEKAVYSRGVIRITGSVKTRAQRERIRREVTAMIREIESTLDLRVKEIDLSGVSGPSEEGPDKEKEQPKLPAPTDPGKPRDEKPAEGGHVVWSVVVWDSCWAYPPPVVWYYPPCDPCWYCPPYAPAVVYPGVVYESVVAGCDCCYP
jgi:hypothetical protein